MWYIRLVMRFLERFRRQQPDAADVSPLSEKEKRAREQRRSHERRGDRLAQGVEFFLRWKDRRGQQHEEVLPAWESDFDNPDSRVHSYNADLPQWVESLIAKRFRQPLSRFSANYQPHYKGGYFRVFASRELDGNPNWHESIIIDDPRVFDEIGVDLGIRMTQDNKTHTHLIRGERLTTPYVPPALPGTPDFTQGEFRELK